MSSISVLDISKIGLDKAYPSEKDFREVSQKIRSCFQETGFMFIVNHGINNQLIEAAFNVSREFFVLDPSIKNLSRKESRESHGWSVQGRETFNQDDVFEVREMFDLNHVAATGRFPDKVRGQETF